MPQSPAPPLTRRSAAALELPSFLRLLAELAATDVGRRRISELGPAPTPAALDGQRRRFAEAERLVAEGPLVPAIEKPIASLVEQVAEAEGGAVGRALLLVADVLDVGRRVVERLGERQEEAAALAGLVAELPAGDDLRQKIARALDRRGRVRDGATPRLAGLRRNVRKIRDSLYQDLQGVAGRYREHLAEETIPMRDGRLVLLLQAGARGRVKGLVQGRSGSGRSVYFEPLEIVEPNNRLQETLEEETAERRRILSELVEETLAARATVEAHVGLVAELDLLQACCRYATRADARLAETSAARQLDLKGARHPLLDPRLADLRERALGTAGHTDEVVALDLALDAERRILVVTGPNAGGKTVALKTAGLLALIHLCGLPVPAEAGTRLPYLSAVTATVGDEQDLLSDRSTFSARLLRWREAWESGGPESLVLLDELGSGTDPEEGAALSVALLEGLLERGTLALITTHLTQVAATALEREGAFCAAMEFDGATGRPTYRLAPGAPGASEALALAARLGLPRRWVARAEELLGPEHRDLRQLLAEVERVRRELAAEQGRLDVERRRLERLRQEAEAESASLREERRQVASRLRKDLDAFRRKVNERLRGEVERLRGELEQGRRKGLAAKAAERLFREAPLADETPPASGGPVATGGRVRHRGLGWEGRVEKLRGGEAEVSVQGKRLRCRVDELVALDGETRPPGRRRPRPVATLAGDGSRPEAGAEINLVGQRVEPALDALDSYLDRALLSPRREVRVIHGFGSGRLRRAVREHLKPHPAVQRFRPGRGDEGGDGATVVTLREA